MPVKNTSSVNFNIVICTAIFVVLSAVIFTFAVNNYEENDFENSSSIDEKKDRRNLETEKEKCVDDSSVKTIENANKANTSQNFTTSEPAMHIGNLSLPDDIITGEDIEMKDYQQNSEKNLVEELSDYVNDDELEINIFRRLLDDENIEQFQTRKEKQEKDSILNNGITNLNNSGDTFEDSLNYLEEINSTTAFFKNRELEEFNLNYKFDKFREQIYSRSSFGSNFIGVDRNDILHESLNKISKILSINLRKKLRIQFKNEEGLDSGGPIKEWFNLVIKEALNPNLGYFKFSSDNKLTIRPSLDGKIDPYYKRFYRFVGRMIGLAIFNNCNIDVAFDKVCYKSILNKECIFTDLKDVDPSYFQSLSYILNNDINDQEFFFEHEYTELGETKIIELIENGSNVKVTNENKKKYIMLKTNFLLTSEISDLIDLIKEGLFEVIDEDLMIIFSELELEQLICGSSNIDVQDLKKNTEIYDYQKKSKVIQWFWRALENFSEVEKKNLLKFVTGSDRVPYGGFAYLYCNNTESRFKIYKSNASNDSLPVSHTCSNILELPEYESYEILSFKLLQAINECNLGFDIN